MRVLVLTSLYPNDVAPHHGVFVENRLRAYLKDYDAEIKVIAPVPWFPSSDDRFGRYAQFAKIRDYEMRHGMEVFHPRYLLAPKLSPIMAPWSMARAFSQSIATLNARGWQFDLIDAHYLFPDAVAATKIAKRFNKPLIATARGSDVTLAPQNPIIRKQVEGLRKSADKIICVSPSLQTALSKLSIDPKKTVVLRNGVDTDFYSPDSQEVAKKKLGIDRPLIVSAGHLIERKGHDILIHALSELKDAVLLILGSGPEGEKLRKLAQELGLCARVQFVGAVPPNEVKRYFNAADVVALASSREGWANVLLEAIACGAPCVASDVGAANETITDRTAGIVVKERTPTAFAAAISAILNDPPARQAVSACAQQFTWRETTMKMNTIFKEALAKTPAAVEKAKARRNSQRHQPQMLITVDTVECFDWSDVTSATHHLSAIEDFYAFQSLCNKWGVRPLYLLTHPLLCDDETATYMRSLKDDGMADFGIHLHAWNTPPLADHTMPSESYQMNLPRALYRDKLRSLSQAFFKVFGEEPIAHRAGRYGVDASSLRLLTESGIRFDFSPCPGFDFRNDDGPDFRRARRHPYDVETTHGTLHVTPLSTNRVVTHTSSFVPETANLALVNVSRTLLKPARLSPEGLSLKEMKALTRSLSKSETPHLTFTLHSSSLTIGGSPYSQTREDRDDVLQKCRDFFDWYVHECEGSFSSLHAMTKNSN